jgi:hypothetical protein
MFMAKQARGRIRMSQLPTGSTDQERYSRRLSDKIQAAFDHACSDGQLEVAAELLETLEIVLLRGATRPERREAVIGPLLASHARLWHLKTGETPDPEPEVPATEPEDEA